MFFYGFVKILESELILVLTRHSCTLKKFLLSYSNLKRRKNSVQIIV